MNNRRKLKNLKKILMKKIIQVLIIQPETLKNQQLNRKLTKMEIP